MEQSIPYGMMTSRAMGENSKTFLVSVGLLLLLPIIVASCDKQARPSAANRTSGQSSRAQEPSTNQESSSPLGHHCLPGSSIKKSTHQAAVPGFKILKNCYFADKLGIRSQNITVETESTSEAGMYRVAKVIRDSGGVWVDTTIVDFVKNDNNHQEKSGRAYLTSQQFGGRIVVTPSKNR
jgi:hypothetical protein